MKKKARGYAKEITTCSNDDVQINPCRLLSIMLALLNVTRKTGF